MKTSLFGLAILLVLCSLFGYYISYNYVYHPFVYEDKNILTNYVDDERVENEELFEYFFIDLIDYKRLINQYEYNFTYCDLDGSFIPLFAQETYCDKGYSLIINCNESYEKEYEYYEERYKTEWPEYYYGLLYLNTGTLSGSVKIHISEQVNEFNDEVFCHIGSGIDIIMAVNYIPGEEKALREIMQKYFEWYPDDYMYNTNEYDYSETGEHIYTKDTISTFGE